MDENQKNMLHASGILGSIASHLNKGTKSDAYIGMLLEGTQGLVYQTKHGVWVWREPTANQARAIVNSFATYPYSTSGMDND